MDTTAIVTHLRQERSRIDQAITALEGLGQTAPCRGRPPKAASAQAVSGRGPRRRMSAAARARIGAAKKAWWAKQKGKTDPVKTAAKKSVSKRKPMSPAMKKKLSAMMKAQWEARKKAR